MSGNPNWYLIAALAIPIIVGIYVSAQNDKREKRKELRSKIDALTALVEEVQAIADHYFCLPADDEKCIELSQSIRSKTKHIASRACDLNNSFANANAPSLSIAFRQAVSLENLDRANRTPLQPDDRLFVKISNCGLLLIQSLENAFRQKFD